jgi:hypothetical protein
METPRKYVLCSQTVSTKKCFICDIDFLISGRTGRNRVQPVRVDAKVNYVLTIKSLVGIDFSSVDYKDARMCNSCKLKLDKMMTLEKDKAEMLKNLQGKAGQHIRVKRAAKGTPTPKKEEGYSKRPNVSTSKCSKSLFGNKENVQPDMTVNLPTLLPRPERPPTKPITDDHIYVSCFCIFLDYVAVNVKLLSTIKPNIESRFIFEVNDLCTYSMIFEDVHKTHISMYELQLPCHCIMDHCLSVKKVVQLLKRFSGLKPPPSPSEKL